MTPPPDKLIILVPKHLQDCPPSVADGTLTLEEELEQRLVGCAWIQKASIFLGVRTEAMSNGQVIFHRFFYRRSMKEFDVKLVAAASLYLGCKLAETPRRVHYLVHVYTYIDWLEWKEQELRGLSVLQNPGTASENVSATSKILSEADIRLSNWFSASLQGHEFQKRRTHIHRVERHILRETGFRICEVLVHPHRFMIQYIHCLFGGIAQQSWRTAVAQRAWGYLNDALRLPLCCMYQPPVLTTAAIYLSIRDNALDLPEEWEWYRIFEVEWRDVCAVVDAIQRLYTAPVPSYRALANPPVPLPSHLSANVSAGKTDLSVENGGTPRSLPTHKESHYNNNRLIQEPAPACGPASQIGTFSEACSLEGQGDAVKPQQAAALADVPTSPTCPSSSSLPTGTPAAVAKRRRKKADDLAPSPGSPNHSTLCASMTASPSSGRIALVSSPAASQHIDSRAPPGLSESDLGPSEKLCSSTNVILSPRDATPSVSGTV